MKTRTWNFAAMDTQPPESAAPHPQSIETLTAELHESLSHQAAVSDILRVITRSRGDVQPVLDLIAERAARLCNANYGFVFRLDGECLNLASSFGIVPKGVELIRSHCPLRIEGSSIAARTARAQALVHVCDVLADSEYELDDVAQLADFRGSMGVPLMREGQVVGVITVTRAEVGRFSDKHVRLLETFASQAVIAIENVRLFDELESRNSELSEALEHRTATSEILRVIASSPSDMQPVFDAIAAAALKLCGAKSANVVTYDGELIHVASLASAGVVAAESLRRHFGTYPKPPSRATANTRAILTRSMVVIPDVLEDRDYAAGATAVAAGYRSVLSVPLMREQEPMGAITVARPDPGPFPEKQIALLQTFADQAAIAMENVRLFQELRARTEALTRSVEELKALGEVGRAVSSTLDLQTVLTTIVSRAAQLSGCHGGVIYEFREDSSTFHVMATHRMDPEHLEALQATPIRLGEGAVGRAGAIQAPVQVSDILDENEPVAPQVRHIVVRLGFRSLLAIPLLREHRLLGGLVVWREASGRFAPEVVGLLQTFAAQSVLAIQNARLFHEIKDKSGELEVANRHKSEFLASMSHELRTPLNAIIGFSEVLRERMFGDLNGKQAGYVEDIHSSGQHLLSLINDILDLSKVEAGRMELEASAFDLPLAIGNALTLVSERAARRCIGLEREIDPRLGGFTGDERKFKQILLNLLSNGIKFTPQGGRITVKAAPVNGAVEVSVSDTGAGIAPEHQEVIFEEFRQLGADIEGKAEGTGLGLALARRFAELHGGTIRVASEPGKGSTFTVRLPLRP